MSETPGWQTLARAVVWSELRGPSWRLFAFPIGAGLLFVGLLGVTALSPGVLTGTTREALAAQAGQYFTGMDGDTALLLAMLVIQGPYFVAMIGAVLAVLVTQTGGWRYRNFTWSRRNWLDQRQAVAECEDSTVTDSRGRSHSCSS